ncbi:methionyl-tRNA formyltransferase-like protein [Trifolium pratense]|uniref:Methionyl-tRNA formyltransferase-like protein n=1 Tax=Trifolium pratense TaxID=57577 RepID=A0A2K3M988_TRIPR|nr:methionyl-tRNA formyltransferase-like protein [Trifolium pratense]
MALSLAINLLPPVRDNLRPQQPLSPQFQFRPNPVKFPIPSTRIRCSSSSSFNDVTLKTTTDNNNTFACRFHTAQFGGAL